MAVDKNLFLHDLAVVAILKNEGHYLKEWLDYHLLAGVDHFYLYDNESPDNQAEVAKPYVEEGLVDYFPAPGKSMQHIVYTEAVKRFKFHCRYMAFIDGDEFIYPKLTGGGDIIEVIDKIFSRDPRAGGLEISWQIFGSNGQEKADYSRGVLERFTRRALNNQNSNPLCKSVLNPRRVNVMTAHCASYFEESYAVNSNNEIKRTPGHMTPPLTDKIVVHHYHTKSLEEYILKRQRGRADRFTSVDYNNAKFYSDEQFKGHDCNDEFDDGIVKYRDVRAKTYQPPDMAHADERLFNALANNLSPTLLPTTPPQFYAGKMETFLTCRAVSSYLKKKLTDDAPAKFFEEASLKAILKSLNGMSLTDARLLLSELPAILNLPYPVVNDVRIACLNIIPQMMNVMHLNERLKDYSELEYLRRLLQTWKPQ